MTTSTEHHWHLRNIVIKEVVLPDNKTKRVFFLHMKTGKGFIGLIPDATLEELKKLADECDLPLEHPKDGVALTVCRHPTQDELRENKGNWPISPEEQKIRRLETMIRAQKEKIDTLLKALDAIKQASPNSRILAIADAASNAVWN